ncbi:hypothetical protein M514_05892 [Trichuris suis]|uniref:Uncharacterized protein n=1 Tax=Trichuris suis TaxID=68888 RepID=A0A085M7I6_9BILA|nr:hypothetical protein M513_05892 [Trichuris suis]KFD60714.1 hypothetical protein M514_05892 [Trichuris suis]
MKSEVVGISSDTISNKMDIANRVVIPRVTFSVRSPLTVVGEKKPNIEMKLMIMVGIMRLTIVNSGFRLMTKSACTRPKALTQHLKNCNSRRVLNATTFHSVCSM